MKHNDIIFLTAAVYVSSGFWIIYTAVPVVCIYDVDFSTLLHSHYKYIVLPSLNT